MTEASIVALAREFFQVTVEVSGPLLLVAVVVGVVVSVAQVLTSVQDATLAYVLRLAGVGLVAVVLARWMVHTLVRYTSELWQGIPKLIA